MTLALAALLWTPAASAHHPDDSCSRARTCGWELCGPERAVCAGEAAGADGTTGGCDDAWSRTGTTYAFVRSEPVDAQVGGHAWCRDVWHRDEQDSLSVDVSAGEAAVRASWSESRTYDDAIVGRSVTAYVLSPDAQAGATVASRDHRAGRSCFVHAAATVPVVEHVRESASCEPLEVPGNPGIHWGHVLPRLP